jgi:hypothetical protein
LKVGLGDGILKSKKCFDVDVLGFQIGLWYRYFGIFYLATVWATFTKVGQFFSKFWITLPRRQIN